MAVLVPYHLCVVPWFGRSLSAPHVVLLLFWLLYLLHRPCPPAQGPYFRVDGLALKSFTCSTHFLFSGSKHECRLKFLDFLCAILSFHFITFHYRFFSSRFLAWTFSVNSRRSSTLKEDDKSFLGFTVYKFCTLPTPQN